MQRKSLFTGLVLAALTAMPLQAAEVVLPDGLKETLAKTFRGQPDRVANAPIKGMYELTYGANIFYVTKDGKYLVNGEVFDLASRTNLTKTRLSSARHDLIEKVDESSMIVYKAKGKEKHVITVFTDIDCGYCRKLHSGMDEMNELGITVRYLAYPRAGVGSPSYDKAVSVWCADDRNKAMDEAKNQNKVTQKSCADAPVREQYELGGQVGVNGTPAIVFSDGQLMPGYAPPKKLAAILDKQVSK